MTMEGAADADTRPSLAVDSAAIAVVGVVAGAAPSRNAAGIDRPISAAVGSPDRPASRRWGRGSPGRMAAVGGIGFLLGMHCLGPGPAANHRTADYPAGSRS